MKLRSNKLDAMTFNSIADLKSFPSSRFSDGAVANVLGYYAPGDGGGGEFVLDLSSVVADNGGTVIAPDAGSGRWKRVISEPGVLKVKWWGIVSDGVTDVSAGLQALVDALDSTTFITLDFSVNQGETDIYFFSELNIFNKFISINGGGATFKNSDISKYQLFYFSGSGVTLGDKPPTRIYNCNFDGNGAFNPLGRAVDYNTGFNEIVSNSDVDIRIAREGVAIVTTDESVVIEQNKFKDVTACILVEGKGTSDTGGTLPDNSRGYGNYFGCIRNNTAKRAGSQSTSGVLYGVVFSSFESTGYVGNYSVENNYFDALKAMVAATGASIQRVRLNGNVGDIQGLATVCENCSDWHMVNNYAEVGGTDAYDNPRKTVSFADIDLSNGITSIQRGAPSPSEGAGSFLGRLAIFYGSKGVLSDSDAWNLVLLNGSSGEVVCRGNPKSYRRAPVKDDTSSLVMKDAWMQQEQVSTGSYFRQGNYQMLNPYYRSINDHTYNYLLLPQDEIRNLPEVASDPSSATNTMRGYIASQSPRTKLSDDANSENYTQFPLYSEMYSMEDATPTLKAVQQMVYGGLLSDRCVSLNFPSGTSELRSISPYLQRGVDVAGASVSLNTSISSIYLLNDYVYVSINLKIESANDYELIEVNPLNMTGVELRALYREPAVIKSNEWVNLTYMAAVTSDVLSRLQTRASLLFELRFGDRADAFSVKMCDVTYSITDSPSDFSQLFNTGTQRSIKILDASSVNYTITLDQPNVTKTRLTWDSDATTRLVRWNRNSSDQGRSGLGRIAVSGNDRIKRLYLNVSGAGITTVDIGVVGNATYYKSGASLVAGRNIIEIDGSNKFSLNANQTLTITPTASATMVADVSLEFGERLPQIT